MTGAPVNGSSNKTIRPASSPAAAGFRPAGAALAIAAAFLSTTDRAHAQPSGGHAIHGQASLSQQGSKLVVTTQNGAGTNHSAINWQSFSVPGGSTTHFQQPGTSSLSINRVVGSDPSSIFGTLSSNGRLVLVNPAGIAVGAGAVVDTAGFTASTLRMSDANALAGRLVFGGDGLGGGALEVNGQIVARSGDVVLIAPNVQVGSQALVQSPNGATVLAAGQKVELTGRGLEGIRLELQAPGDQALNLGTLQGDAVGIFAGQLKHSGLIQATGISTEGGKVVLKGLDKADISGRVTATQGDKGGQVHATANKVMLRSGAVIHVSGEKGGGEALVGGGWQGQDGRISNSVETLVEAGAAIKADAINSGNGGTIVAWSDGSTRVYGALSARGGAASGDGGNIETSGHYLDMQGQVDTSAPNGKMGNLLLDPTNVYIADSLTTAAAAGMVGSNQTSTGPNFTPTGVVQDSLVTVSSLESFLSGANVTVQTANPSGTGSGFIKVVDGVDWTGSSSQLSLMADNSIMVDAPITGGAGSALGLRAFSGNITQGAGGSIAVPNLFAYADAGSVNLTNSGNTVSTLSGYATAAGGFSFVNSGALTIGSVSTAAGLGNGIRTNNQSIQVATLSGDLTVADTTYGADAGTGSVSLMASSGAIVQTTGAKVTAGGGIMLEADRMNLQGGLGSISAGASVLWVKPKTGGWKIDLGSTADSTANTLEISTNELNTFAGTGALRIGSLMAGDMNISAAIAPAHSGTLTLESGGNITQAGPGTISADKLAIRALGNVTLDTASNMVNNLAASIGDATNTNRVFSFRNASGLNIGAGIDGISGIQIQASGGGYDPLSPDAYMSLISGGALTQSAGALIGAKAIYAEGTRVALTEGNFTGVIAGKATGAATGDIFAYRSVNGINVNNVGAGSGIQNASGPDAIAIELTGTDVSQRAGSLITAAGGLRLVTTGPVNLSDTGNNVSALTVVGAGPIVYRNAGALTVGIGGAGISSTGSVDIRTADALTVQSTVSGNGVILKATGAGKDLNINSTVSAGSGGMDLLAANDILLNNATLSAGSTTILSAGNAAKVTAGTSTLNTNLSGSTLYVQGTLVIGAPVIVDSLSLVAGGTITGGGDLTVGSNLFWSGGSMTGTGDTIIAPGATANITGPVSLMRHLVNASGGTIILSGSGQINAMSPGFMDNMGAFDIQNDGGFTGSAFTINNSGMFGKTAGTGVSMLNGVNFTNTGTLGVASGTMQFGSGGFSSNSGWVGIAPGATLDNSNTTLANTSAGVIGGSGTLRLGTGTLNNSGTLKPGGPGAVGTLTIDAATVNLDAGTYIYADLLDTVNYDRLYVTGNVNLASGVTVVPDTTAATELLPGDSFDILQSSLGSVGGTLPVVTGFDVTFETSPAPALRVALAVPPVAPAPAPTASTGSMMDQAIHVLGDEMLAQEVLGELSSNPLAIFTALLEKEEEQATEATGTDNVVDNNQCVR
jgi:filamentous hemagglutinin family protein